MSTPPILLWSRLAAACALLTSAALAPATLAQTWENLPLVPFVGPNGQGIDALGFLRAEGDDADDPALDSLVAFSAGQSTLLYNPSGADGAAGDNGILGAWHALCQNSYCHPRSGLVTAANALVFGGSSGATGLAYSSDRGRTWAYVVDGFYGNPVHESALPGLAAPDGSRGLIAVVSGDGRVARSLGGGAPGTWTQEGVVGSGGGLGVTFGEVPPSASLPTGRLLLGVWNGVTGSTDGGLSFQPTSAYGQGLYIAYSFAFLPVDGHPYGGTAFTTLLNTALYPWQPAAELHRSEDGGATWTLAHRFTPEETGLPLYPGQEGGPASYLISQATVFVTPDGALWAAVNSTPGGPQQPGVILRSTDEGETWTRADAGYEGYDVSGSPAAYGWRVRDFALARDGRLYAATERGVWRTAASVVAGEAWPTPATLGLSLSVSPNPSRGLMTLSLSARETQQARVTVTDVTGREVEAVEVWATPEGASVVVDASSWASGVYVARASVGRHTEHVTARFTIAR